MLKDGYSLCLNEWALDKDIKNELGLLLIISSLCAENGLCWASNQYFAELFNEPEQTISRKIKKLKEKGYINITYERRGSEITKRELRLTKLLTDHSQKCESTVNKNVKENIISINNNIHTSIEDGQESLIPSEDTKQGKEPVDESKLSEDFDKIWKEYPRKEGKQQAFNHYKAWLNGTKKYAGRNTKLTNKQMWYATRSYALRVKDTETKYIQQASRFFNDTIMEYVEEESDLE